jgi:glycine C-acetyltransferase
MRSSLDRRGMTRIAVKGEKRVNLESPRGTAPGVLHNLTAQGALITTAKKYPLNSFIKVSVGTKALDPLITLKAKVVWRKPIVVNGELFEEAKYWKHGVLFFQSQMDSSQLIQTYYDDDSVLKDRRLSDRREHPANVDRDSRRFDRRGSKTLSNKLNRLGNSFDKWTTYHTYLRSIESTDSATAVINGQRKLMLGSNCYTGLANHPLVKEAAIKAIERFGVGSGGVPVLSGTTVLHEELCETVARFKGAESAILYPSGYIANFTCLSSMFADDAILLNDERNHASIVDGCRMSGAKVRFFKHNDVSDLEKRLAQYPREQTKLVIVDGVFSMDGDVCDLPAIYDVAQRYNAMIMVDDAHSTGVLGKNGRGTADHFGLTGKIDLTTVTLSKSVGCIGGAICGPKNLIKFLVHISRSYIFSTSLPPPICAAAIAAFKVLESEPQIVETLHRNVNFLKRGLSTLGFNVAPTESAIVPIIIGDEMLTYKFAHALDELGVFVNAVSRPAVARELSRLRVSATAQHSLENLQEALNAFQRAGKALGII